MRQIIDRFEFQPQHKAVAAAAAVVHEFPTAAVSVRELIKQFNGLLDGRDGQLDWVGRRPMQFCCTNESTGCVEKLQECDVEREVDSLKVDEVRPVEWVDPDQDKQVEIVVQLLNETETIVSSVVEYRIFTMAEESTESDASTANETDEQLTQKTSTVTAFEEPITATFETYDVQSSQDPSEASAVTTERDAIEELLVPIMADSSVLAYNELNSQDPVLAKSRSAKSKASLPTSRSSKTVQSTGCTDKVTSRYLDYQATSRYARIQEANIQRRKMNELKRSEQTPQTARSAEKATAFNGTRANKSVSAVRRQTLECSKLAKALKSSPTKRPKSAPVSRQSSQEKKSAVWRDKPVEAQRGRPRRASAPNATAAGLAVPRELSSIGSIKHTPGQRPSSTESLKAKLKNVQSRLFAFETDPQHLQKVEANRSRVVSLKMRNERVAR